MAHQKGKLLQVTWLPRDTATWTGWSQMELTGGEGQKCEGLSFDSNVPPDPEAVYGVDGTLFVHARQCTHPCRSPEFSHATHSSWGPARSNVHGRLRVALGSACRCWTRAHASEREPIADSSAVRSALPQPRPRPDSSLANPIEVWSTSRPGGITAAAQQLEP